MKVLLATSAGFCWGVQRAVDKAQQLAGEPGETVHTDGPLIHNNQMMGELRRQGVTETSDPSSLESGTLLVRAHGIPPDRRAELNSLPVRLVDATCPDVARIQGLIRKHARLGLDIVIYGDPGHAEVVGLLGFAEGRGHVVSTTDDVAQLPELSQVCVVSQSTQFPAAYGQIGEAVGRRFPGAVVLDTICTSTRNRQDELVRLAVDADAIVVVGGAHSANTLRLVELARTLRPTVHIQTADQLSPGQLGDAQTVALTAGASTPAFIIDEVKSRLESM